MAALERLEDDLGYVRNVVHRAENPPGPTAVYLLWAAIVLAGFPLGDFAPTQTGKFWMIVGPLGWVISAVIGARHARRVGEYDKRVGIRHLTHWGTMMLMIFLAGLMAWRGFVDWQAMGPIVLLLVGLTYILAAVHLDRMMLWPGVMMVVGYLVLLAGVGYTWTVIGILVSGGLVVSSLAGGRRRAAEA